MFAIMLPLCLQERAITISCSPRGMPNPIQTMPRTSSKTSLQTSKTCVSIPLVIGPFEQYFHLKPTLPSHPSHPSLGLTEPPSGSTGVAMRKQFPFTTECLVFDRTVKLIFVTSCGIAMGRLNVSWVVRVCWSIRERTRMRAWPGR